MIKNKKILITGNTSGLGFALTEILLAGGNKVFSLSKRPLKKRKNLKSAVCNLKDINKLDLRAALDHIGISSLNRLLEEIGSGERTANIVAHQMAGRLGKPHYVKKKSI